MPSEPRAFETIGPRIGLCRPSVVHAEEFLALAQANAEFLRPWVEPPTTREKFESYLQRLQSATDDGFLICELSSNRIAGVINVSCIVRGVFQSPYLGYWIGEAFARRGYITEAMNLLIRYAFGQMGLHRLEANIQPQNLASIALVRRCGFRREGYSPKYLKIFGEWRDHERWAILADGG